MVKTVKGAKIAGADIVPATQLYTEDYMVKFLVQNSLGATWRGMYPDSKLGKRMVDDETAGDDQTTKSVWEYYVEEADRVPVKKKPVRDITLLDPACGSGHFLIEAFDMFYDMYMEEGVLNDPSAICLSILENNLFGIDIDLRAIQIAEVALWMKAADRVAEFNGTLTGLVAAVASHLKGESWERFLDEKFRDEPSVPRVLRKFAIAMTNIDQLGTLARPAEELEEIIREEHETWEKQQAAGKESNFLFSEMLDDVLAGQLPFREMSDEQFGHRMMNRAIFAIDGFTQEARDRQEFDDSLLGAEARRGFRLLQLLSTKYDVVVANPPYMGSKNMGLALKQFVGKKYKSGKRDLYAAFIIRSLMLTKRQGACALVTQQYWMSNCYFRDLRCSESPPTGIVRQNTISVMAHLGPNAFSEISGEVVSVVMAIFHNGMPSHEHRSRFIRLVDLESPTSKDQALVRSVNSESTRNFCVTQKTLLAIPDSPIVYWLPPKLFERLTHGKRLISIAVPYEGCHPTDTPRFVRFHWEAPVSSRWSWYSRGGEFCRWHGLKRSLIDSEMSFSRHYATGKAIIPSRERYFMKAITYTDFASGNLAARVLEDDEIFSDAAPAVIPHADSKSVLALMNSRVMTLFMRVLSPSPQHFRTGYLAKAPVPEVNDDRLMALEECCIAIKREMSQSNLIERDFVPSTFKGTSNLNGLLKELLLGALLCSCEAGIEKLVYAAYRLDEEDIRMIESVTGKPVGTLPVVSMPDEASFSSLLKESTNIEKCWKEASNWLSSGNDFDQLQNPPNESIHAINEQLRSLFSNGPGYTSLDETLLNQGDSAIEVESENVDDSDDGEIEEIEALVRIPFQSFTEELASKVGIHAISAFSIVSDGIRNSGWRCVAYEQQRWKDWISTQVLQLLGFCWSRQIEEVRTRELGEKDGIVPAVMLSTRPSLAERVIERLNANNLDERNFRGLFDKSIEHWLQSEFFSQHVKQFKKRPVCWHIRSSTIANGLRAIPSNYTFECFISYHKLDADTIQKIRSSEFVAYLRQRFETELRSISLRQSTNHPDLQNDRSIALHDAISDLQLFDETLEAIALYGFGPKFLVEKLRQNAIDEAFLLLKITWLRRLSEFILKEEINDWCDDAEEKQVHPELDAWIRRSIASFEPYSVAIGIGFPVQALFETDPTSIELAALVCTASSEMTAAAVKCSCAVWWKQLDQAVFKPMKDRVKSLKEDQVELESSLEGLQTQQELSLSKIGELKEAIKRVKAEIKTINAELKTKTASAKKLREKIESWRSDEPTKWGDWLAEQPMFV